MLALKSELHVPLDYRLVELFLSHWDDGCMHKAFMLLNIDYALEQLHITVVVKPKIQVPKSRPLE